MEKIDILKLDKSNNLLKFLKYKELLEKELQKEELSINDFINYININKYVFIYETNYTFSFNIIKINNEDILFYTDDESASDEIRNLFLEKVDNFNIDKMKKMDMNKEYENPFPEKYYFIVDGEFYY